MNVVLPQVGQFVLAHPLVQLALISLFLVVVGGVVQPGRPPLGRLMRTVGNMGLVVALLLSVANTLHIRTGFDTLDDLGDNGGPDMTISGRETRARLGDDGHFWLAARIGDTKARFLVDTGATITTLAPETADRAGLEPDPNLPPITLTTANGTTRAARTTIPSLRFGTVVVRNLHAVVAPGIGGTNVLGMNVLSKLASWRVEGDTLILVPHDAAGGGAGSDPAPEEPPA